MTVRLYVNDLWVTHKHVVSRAALSSGEWLMVFTNPHRTFNEGVSDDPEQIAIFHLGEYLERSNEILELLGRQELSATIPPFLSPGQLTSYLAREDVARVFHAIRVRYETSGFSYAVQRPRILVQPVVTIERRDGVLLNFAHGDEDFLLDNRPEQLTTHLSDVGANAKALLAYCSNEVGDTLVVSSLAHFPGFTSTVVSSAQRAISKSFAAQDEWLYITGTATHFLAIANRCSGCKFHAWSACSQVGEALGSSAASSKSVSYPRNFFVDGEANHCAHKLIIDRRLKRCVIDVFETRACCQGCAFMQHCWSGEEVERLPCET